MEVIHSLQTTIAGHSFALYQTTKRPVPLVIEIAFYGQPAEFSASAPGLAAPPSTCSVSAISPGMKTFLPGRSIPVLNRTTGLPDRLRSF